MINSFQLDELLSNRWPTQVKEEKIQKQYSPFSQKIHNEFLREELAVEISTVFPNANILPKKSVEGQDASSSDQTTFQISNHEATKVKSAETTVQESSQEGVLGQQQVIQALPSATEQGKLSTSIPLTMNPNGKGLEQLKFLGILPQLVEAHTPQQGVGEVLPMNTAGAKTAGEMNGAAQQMSLLKGFDSEVLNKLVGQPVVRSAGEIGTAVMNGSESQVSNTQVAVPTAQPSMLQAVSTELKTNEMKETEEGFSKEEVQDASLLLLQVCDQALLMQQLQQNPSSLTKLMDMLQGYLANYGDVPLRELPQEALQQLSHIEQFLDNGMSIGQVLGQLKSEAAPMQLQVEQINLLPQGEDAPPINAEQLEAIRTTEPLEEKQNPATSFVDSLFSTVDTAAHKAVSMQGSEGGKSESMSFSDLHAKIQQKVEEIQKFVMKNERIFLQVNREDLGKVELYVKKEHDSIRIHVEIGKEEGKKQLDAIFEDIKAKLKEQNIQVEITYTEREREQQRQQEEQQRENRYTEEQQRDEHDDPFTQLLEGIEYE